MDHCSSNDEDVQDPEHYGAKEDLTEDHGTCQHSFLSPDGDAVSVTASINLIWGCKFMSPSTGIIMNNQVTFYLFSFKRDMITPTDDMSNIISHNKLLLIPIDPPIFDSKVTSSTAKDVFETKTFFPNFIMSPLSF